ncbi:hypothetical protein CDG76_05915 [Nostoc sp. 'Peltigera membranacea cyanobiont' 210A]|uniref:hypothetical protein n=1 Tax=Nostoc sp. 'Peltigera membranacea cyanobiont' 210A TaxID=2014529 RepID=UPI000B959658|nr:hypothetical protein [Nostoc sp. 'Peltigera membranacea cyanobiont' 210A]OYD96944.1 hypothetical protein CDG76_05915 [Nostoc sp. 'Peltigera membranacea cyanobiont' 210A]
MKTITSLFSEERNQLQIDIDNTIGIEQIVKLVQNRLDNLERIYIEKLNLAQVRLASFFLDTLRQSIATLAAANYLQVAPTEQRQITNTGTKLFSSRFILKLLKGLIYIGILGSLFSLTKTTPGAWMAILLTSLLIGLEIVLQLESNNQQNNSISEGVLELPQPILRVDSKVFLDCLGDALNTIDLAVARVEQGNKHEGDLAIEELPELLNFLQRLMGASKLDKPQMAYELAKLLPQILMSQGINAQIYRSNSDREYFDFEPSIDPDTKEHVTLTPALLKGDRLIRRGRVIEPAYSSARE